MIKKYRAAEARRVIVGIREDGQSAVLSDEFTAQRVSTPAFVINDVWESPSFPVPISTPAPTGKVTILPPQGGLVVRICTFPPDSAYDKSDYQASLEALQGGDTFQPECETEGMHFTKSLDVVTVVAGELHIVLETGATLLRQGDSVVMKGGSHSWSNKGDKPAILCSIIMSSTLLES